jgi:uncharacterized membrane protein
MAAIIWIGGMIFASLVLQPVLRKALSPEIRMPIYQDMGKRFKTIQLTSLGILLATGVFKLWGFKDKPEIFFSPFGAILAIKLTLVACVIFLTGLHSYAWGPRLVALAHQAQDVEYRTVMGKLVFWGRINLALSVAVIFCAALLRFN